MATTSSLGFISINALRQYFRFAQARGLGVADLCQAAGLSPELALATSGEITGAEFQHFLGLLLAAANDPLLGLRVGDYVEPGSYNVLGYITMSCATLGEAIERIVPYEKLVGDMGITRLRKRQGRMELQWQCGYPDPRVRHHIIDNIFSSWINYARWLCDRQDIPPLLVDLEHEAPSMENQAAYTDRWQCPVRFAQPANRVCFSPDLLAIPLRQPDPIIRQTLEDHARDRLAGLQPGQRFVTQVRHTLYQRLRQGVTRQDLVAQDLALTPRTLQRKLAQENLSYQGLLDELREQLAREYLGDPALPLMDIALRLGFSDDRSFHRRFKLWTGMTPGRFRALSSGD